MASTATEAKAKESHREQFVSSALPRIGSSRQGKGFLPFPKNPGCPPFAVFPDFHRVFSFPGPVFGVAESPARYDAEPPCPAEWVLQSIWNQQLLRPEALVTLRGQKVEVLAPGFWNSGPGPDFLRAVIRVGGRLLRGDVEVHRRGSDWKAHGHSLNPLYDEVMLSVEYEAGDRSRAVIKRDGSSIPRVAIREALAQTLRQLESRFGALGERRHRPAPPGRCRSELDPEGEEGIARILELAGDLRLDEKRGRFQGVAAAIGPEEAVYRHLLEGLGYSRYRKEFVRISEKAPLSACSGLSLGEIHSRMASALEQAGPRTRPFGVRPANRPEQRLAGAAVLARRLIEGEIGLAAWLAVLDFPPRKAAFTLEKSLQVLDSKGSAPVGRARARVLVVNAVIPALLATAHEKAPAIARLYRCVPSTPPNSKERTVLDRLFGDFDHLPIPLNARRRQGLLYIGKRWCLTDPLCRSCRVLPLLRVGNAALS